MGMRPAPGKVSASILLFTAVILIVPSSAIECGVEERNCHILAYCENITVGGEYVPTCVCPAGTIGDEDHRDNDPPFTSGICNKDLWTVRYVKEATVWGEWRTCAGGRQNGDPNHGREHCHECKGQLRYGRDDPTAHNYPGPWWTLSTKPLPETTAEFACSAEWFEVQGSDPYPNEFKACDCRELVELDSEKWSKCAEEHGECICDGTVVYGSDLLERGYAIHTTDGEETVSCSNNNQDFFDQDTFREDRSNGDPDYGQYKACYCFEGVNRTFMSEYAPALISSDKGYGMCEAGAGSYYFRRVGDTLEVNCLYDNETLAEIEQPDYYDETYLTEPRVYRWVLPTTAEPIEIPPTGMEVQQVYFNASCAETGCWVLKGIMTTGEAFNDFSAFNTFYLPQAVGDDELSSDFDYSDVAWTFEPSKAPCSSVDYEAGVTPSIFKISYCCISEPTVGEADVEAETGGFAANYRPTQNFLEWVGEKYVGACDLKFNTGDGRTKCWKAFSTTQEDTADQAMARCLVAGGTLPTIANATENQMLVDLAGERFGSWDWTWLGARDREAEASFAWQDDTPGPGQRPDSTDFYQNWRNNEPNNVNYGAFGEDCVEMRNNGGWNDQSCSQESSIHKYFCQFTNEDVCRTSVIQRPRYTAPVDRTATPCWDVKHSAMNYTDAQATCAADGGSLAKVDTPEKFHLMKRMLDSVNPGQNVMESWIGLDDLEEEATFKWIIGGETMVDVGHTGGTTQFTGWRTGIPGTSRTAVNYRFGWPWSWANSDIYDGDVYDCTAVTNNGRWWQDFPCDEVKKFVCEYPRAGEATCDSDMPNLDAIWNIPFPVNYDGFLVGQFKGMDVSPGVVDFTNIDPYFGQFSFTVHLDEKELRTKAGRLTGTVGVEHTIDTFLGLSNFRPTGLANGVIDTFSTQTALHLEKTNFFTVSTHGTNAYTFLEYVNLRLVTVLQEDTDFSGNELERTTRTDPTGNVNYLQVTFTMGAQYAPNLLSGGLIPLDSVRVGRGTFFDAVEAANGLEQVCSEFDTAADSDDIGLQLGRVEKRTFTDALAQECAPKSTMCLSPQTVPDSFVSFNVPLGEEVFDGATADDLSSNVFVDMVINAVDTTAQGVTVPNDGEDSQQMKTTLTASIPIVEGGINVFCDGLTARTDLKDVANADIIVGSASSGAELTRLRVIEDIASTTLSAVPRSDVSSSSIEAGMLTLILRGDNGYFSSAGDRNAGGFSLELDDLITIHLMEDGDAGTVDAMGVSTNSKENVLLSLLAEAPDDNSDSATGLDTSGYGLNGAFKFDVDRARGIAMLNPTAALLEACPFGAARPLGTVPLESCITRRDVRERGFPVRVGAGAPTATEVLAQAQLKETDDLVDELAGLEGQRAGSCGCDSSGCCEAGFMQSVLGSNDLSRGLGVDFAKTIHERYTLNGRYTRAFWINPGYEWTPTQTAGKSRFAVSQKLYLFALISMDENVGRRRMLLATDGAVDLTEGTGTGTGAANINYVGVTQKSMLAQAFEVAEEQVAKFTVQMRLTAAEACLPDDLLQTALQVKLSLYMETAASAHHTVSVVAMQRFMGDEVCSRRKGGVGAPRRLLDEYSSATATATTMVVFMEEEAATINPEALEDKDSIIDVTPAESNVAVTLDTAYGREPLEDGSDGLSTTTVIIIACAAAGGVLLCLGLALVVMRARMPSPSVVEHHTEGAVVYRVDKATLLEECAADPMDPPSKPRAPAPAPAPQASAPVATGPAVATAGEEAASPTKSVKSLRFSEAPGPALPPAPRSDPEAHLRPEHQHAAPAPPLPSGSREPPTAPPRKHMEEAWAASPQAATARPMPPIAHLDPLPEPVAHYDAAAPAREAEAREVEAAAAKEAAAAEENPLSKAVSGLMEMVSPKSGDGVWGLLTPSGSAEAEGSRRVSM